MRRLIVALAILAICACAFVPSVCFTEDKSTVALARTIYALGKNEDYDTKLKLGTVVMNRSENAWFKGGLSEVLADQQQFPAGRRYDDDSLRAAHELISGRRALSADALYYQSVNASDPWGGAHRVAQSGSYCFYSEKGIL